MLLYANGDKFSTGVITCEIAPLNIERDRSNRIRLLVLIEDVATEAVIDTGGIYCILHPVAAQEIGFDPSVSIGNHKVNIRGVVYKGSLFRANLKINAEEGEGLIQEVTVFVPDGTPEQWGDLPTFLGLTGCLERLRFAVDPAENKFYFGAS